AVDDGEPDEAADGEPPALDEEGERREDEGDDPERGSAGREGDGVVEPAQDVADDVEDGTQCRGQPVDEDVDPLAEGDAELVHRASPSLVLVLVAGASCSVPSPDSLGAMAWRMSTRGMTPTSRPASSRTASGSTDDAAG